MRIVPLMPRNFLVTGGAGFIGSHLVAAILDAGDRCVVLDDLSTGHGAAVLPGASFIEADCGDRAAMDAVFGSQRFDAVFHFAAKSLVGESMRDPLGYFEGNMGRSLSLIRACVAHGVGKFVFSSTAALFSPADTALIDETCVIAPLSPYGESKWMVERALHWADAAHGMHSACLRYFNAAGSDMQGRLGEDHRPETHLVPLVIDAALGRLHELAVFGEDYPTSDGTCIRDYIHIADLAQAHLLTLSQLEHRSVSYNLGNGQGSSVREVISAVERLTGRRVPVRVAPRRGGDAPSLVASSRRIMTETGWQPRHAALDVIVGSALAWREANPGGYAG